MFHISSNISQFYTIPHPPEHFIERPISLTSFLKVHFVFLTQIDLSDTALFSIALRWRFLGTSKDRGSVGFLISHCTSKTFILFPPIKDFVSMKHVIWDTIFNPMYYFIFRLLIGSGSDIKTFGIWLIVLLLLLLFCITSNCT